MADERILLADDDPELRQVVATYLSSEGFNVIQAADGGEALRLWQEQRPDLLILDWMMPKASGLEIARTVRAQSTVPIIMLTARSEESDKLLGLEFGADDYLTKPFSMRELVARMRAVLRRSRAETVAPVEAVTYGDVSIDFVAHTVRRGGEEVTLTATEMKLLSVLARHPNRVFSRLQLVETALGDYYEGFERTVDSHISHLRKKLGTESLIQTIKGAGYKLVPPKE